jgi:predicted HicB family RNase H-like nuclease
VRESSVPAAMNIDHYTLQAAEQGVSLNRLASAKLAG